MARLAYALLWGLWVVLWAAIRFSAGLIWAAMVCLVQIAGPVVLILALTLGLLIASASPAEAGWFSWFWGSDTQHLEQALDVAQESARVANQAAEAQSRQAAAQAEQNARLAETLTQLSNERASIAAHLRALLEITQRDSQWAAAVNQSGPVAVCVAVLLVGGLALWVVNRPGEARAAELAEVVNLLVHEVTADATGQEPGAGHCYQVPDAPEGLLGPGSGAGSRGVSRLPVVAPAGSRSRSPAPENSGGPEQPADEHAPMPF
jgi:hypothetical protein